MAKATNYTQAQVDSMTSIYKSATNEAERQTAMEQICKDTGKALNSVRAKLSSLGIYVAKVTVAKKATSKTTKADMVANLEKMAGEDVPTNFFDSMEATTKNVLEYFTNVLKQRDDLLSEFNADNAEDDTPEGIKAAQAAVSAS